MIADESAAGSSVTIGVCEYYPQDPASHCLGGCLTWLRRLLHPPGTAMEYMEAVVVAEREGQAARAARLCELGLQRFSDDFYLIMKREAQVRDAGDAEGMERLLDRARAHCPETAATFTSMGEEYARLGQLPVAEEYFRRALARTPANSLIREKLAMALVQQGRMDEGVAELMEAAGAEPENQQREGLLINVLLQAGRFQDVVERLQKVPESRMSWEGLMALSVAKARLDGAVELADALMHPERSEPG